MNCTCNSTQLDINYTKYFIKSNRDYITTYFHGTCQQFINVNDLNRLFSSSHITFRRTKKDEDLSGKLIFNRVGKFGIDIHD